MDVPTQTCPNTNGGLMKCRWSYGMHISKEIQSFYVDAIIYSWSPQVGLLAVGQSVNIPTNWRARAKAAQDVGRGR